MTRIRSISDIGLVYEQMRKNAQPVTEDKTTEVVEEKAVKSLPTFPKADDKKINTAKLAAKGSDKNAFVHKDSGPAAALKETNAAIDPKTAKKDNHYEPQKFSTALEKTGTQAINNDMSKSIFDKLYEDVMKDDALDLGIKAGPEGEAGDHSADLDLSHGEDTVTLKLDKDLAQKLHDALVDVLGGGEGEGEAEGEHEAGSEDLGGEAPEANEEAATEAEEANEEAEEDKEEDKKEVAKEGIDVQPAPKHLPDSHGKSLEKKGGVPTVGNVKPKGGKASGDVLKGAHDGKLSALPDSKGHSLTGKNNKVNAPGYNKGEFFK